MSADPAPPPAPPAPALPLDEEGARRIVDGAARRYFARRRDMVGPFIDRHFTLLGSLRLHRRAVGWDLLRAPANVALAVPNALAQLTGAAARRVGARGFADWLTRRPLLLRTDVDREVAWRIETELLELPARDGDRVATRDALAEEILADPLVQALLADRLGDLATAAARPDFLERMTQALAAYAGTRAAAADVAAGLAAAAAGALAFKQFTPGVGGLGPLVAGAVAQQVAVTAFPLGATLGNLWYAAFPASAGVLLTTGVVAGLLVTVAALTPFANVVADPLQRALGLHQRRLLKLIDVLEAGFHGQGDARFVAPDAYVARLLDLLEYATIAVRALR